LESNIINHTYNVKNATWKIHIGLFKIKIKIKMKCMDLIVHISLSFLEGKNETWHLKKKFIKK
jgi:hypothetical protein